MRPAYIGSLWIPGTQRTVQSEDNADETLQQNQKNNLEFDIYYTDALGERRIVNMELPLKMSSALSTGDGEIPEGFAGRMGKQQEESGTNWTLWIVLGIVIVVGFILYKKYPKQTKEFYIKSKQKTTELFHKNSLFIINNDIKIPDSLKKIKIPIVRIKKLEKVDDEAEFIDLIQESGN